jgi:hypothetical protein
MKKFVVKLNLQKKSIPQKIELGKGVVLAMTGNPLFGTVTNPTILLLNAATTALETALNGVTAAGGGTSLTAIMHQKEDAFDVSITGMGRNVDNIAKGDKVIILSAGMEADKEREPAQLPGTPTALEAKPGDMPGTVDLKWKRPQFGLFFNVYASTDPPNANSWVLKGQTTKSKATISGLNSMTSYWFKVEAIGTVGTGPQSDPAKSVVL